MFLSFFIPFRKSQYVLTIPKEEFIHKLTEVEKKLKDEYEPGKNYIIHEPEKKSFLFKNVKFHTSKQSGVISRFQYEFLQEATLIKSSFRYATIFYIFLPLIIIILPAMFHKVAALGLLAPVVVYTIFCFFLHLESWVVTEEFKSAFKDSLDFTQSTVPLS